MFGANYELASVMEFGFYRSALRAFHSSFFSNLNAELQRLARDSGSDEVRKKAEGALWVLEDKASAEDSANTRNTGDNAAPSPIYAVITSSNERQRTYPSRCKGVRTPKIAGT